MDDMESLVKVIKVDCGSSSARTPKVSFVVLKLGQDTGFGVGVKARATAQP